MEGYPGPSMSAYIYYVGLACSGRSRCSHPEHSEQHEQCLDCSGCPSPEHPEHVEHSAHAKAPPWHLSSVTEWLGGTILDHHTATAPEMT